MLSWLEILFGIVFQKNCSLKPNKDYMIRTMAIFCAGELDHPSEPVVGSCALRNCRDSVPVLCNIRGLLTRRI